MLYSKPAIWLYSLFIALLIAFVLHIFAIGAEEYAQFDKSIEAITYAKRVKALQTFYVLVIIGIYFMLLTKFVVKKTKKVS